MNYVASAPKESKSNTKEKKVYKGRYFGPVLNSLGANRQERSDNHVWSGFLSPSNELAWDMCMDDVYDRLCKPYEMDSDGGEIMAFLGSAFHAEFEKRSKWVKDFHYDCRSRILPQFINWQKHAWPEIVGECNVSGWKWKADSVLKNPDNGRPDVFDLKSAYRDPKTWDEVVGLQKIPKEKDTVQVSTYGYEFELNGTLPAVNDVGLGYFNAVINQFKLYQGDLQYAEFWWPFDLIRDDIAELIYRAARHRRFKLLEQRQSCDYRFCKKHGTETSKAMLKIRNYLRGNGDE